MKNKLWLIVLVIVVVTLLVVGGGIGIFFGAVVGAYSAREKKYPKFEFEEGTHGDRIHFIPTGHSDAILIESDGKFGMVDGGEDTDNPRGFSGLELDGYEDVVVAYIKKIAGDANGKVTLDFVLGTHAHSDHIGGLDTVINDPDITVNKAYLKRYYEDRITDNEVKNWDNAEVYNQMVDAVNARGVELIQGDALVDAEFTLGNFNITIFNGEEPKEGVKVGENENSLGVLLEKGGKKTFLSGDMNNYDGDEDRLGPIIGKVDVMKLGHHGLNGSTSKAFLKNLNPSLIMCTNNSSLPFQTSQKIVFQTKAPVFFVGKAEYSIVDFSGDEIKLLYKKN